MACGAIARNVADVAARRGWPVDVTPLPPLLHNRPERIAAAVERALFALRPRYARIAVGYAEARMRALLEAEPGTYVLTDYLATSFPRSVVGELGLDRHPELRDDYFGHYRRVVWLAQHPTARLRAAAQRAADAVGLPLEEVVVGDVVLEQALDELMRAS